MLEWNYEIVKEAAKTTQQAINSSVNQYVLRMLGKMVHDFLDIFDYEFIFYFYHVVSGENSLRMYLFELLDPMNKVRESRVKI